MRVDDQDVPIEIVQYLKDAITNLPEAELIFDCRNVNTLMEGLNQKTPNIATLRARVSARLEARAVPAPILNVLRTATLCQKVFSVLSLKAIKHGGNDWAAYFGLEAYVGSLLVDERTEVRSYGREVWARLPKSKAQAANATGAEKNLLDKFNPFLLGIQSLINGIPPQKPQSAQPVSGGQDKNISDEEKANLIEASAVVKSLRKQIEKATQTIHKHATDLQVAKAREAQLKEALAQKTDELKTFENQKKDSIAQGVRDALQNRLGSWFEPTQALMASAKFDQSPMAYAEEALTKQSTIDARYHTWSSLRVELANAKALQKRLHDARTESLRVAPEIETALGQVNAHIEQISINLRARSIAPDNARLQAIADQMNSATSIEEAMALKKRIHTDMAQQSWPQKDGARAIELINRRMLTLYSAAGGGQGLKTDDLRQIAPLHVLRKCVMEASPCWILVDGHNLLHKIKPFIGAQYFDRAGAPNMLARELLTHALRDFVSLHVNFECQLWFDGPDDNTVGVADKLRVYFSGGKGSNRADDRIVEALSALHRTDPSSKFIVVSDDMDLLSRAKKINGTGMSSVEFWLGFLSN